MITNPSDIELYQFFGEVIVWTISVLTILLVLVHSGPEALRWAKSLLPSQPRGAK